MWLEDCERKIRNLQNHTKLNKTQLYLQIQLNISRNILEDLSIKFNINPTKILPLFFQKKLVNQPANSQANKFRVKTR